MLLHQCSHVAIISTYPPTLLATVGVRWSVWVCGNMVYRGSKRGGIDCGNEVGVVYETSNNAHTVSS